MEILVKHYKEVNADCIDASCDNVLLLRSSPIKH